MTSELVLLQYGAIGAILLLCLGAVYYQDKRYSALVGSLLADAKEDRQAYLTVLDNLVTGQKLAHIDRQLHDERMTTRNDAIAKALDHIVDRLEIMNSVRSGS